MGDLPRMYTDIADWWPLLSAPEDYEEEAGLYARVIREACPGAKAVLELGSGGGNNASHMKAHFDLTLVDPAPGMLAMSRALNPECEHVRGDMRDVRLGRAFDAVFVHDAVMYMATEVDLARAMETAFVHTRPGGVALFVPDFMGAATPSTTHGGHDAPDGRGLRYLEWQHDPDPSDTTFVSDFVYMLREADAGVTVVQDRHVMGIFSEETWVRLAAEAGFVPELLPPGMAEEVGKLLLARRPG